MIKAVIVDDEPYSCEVLGMLLQKYCPEVSVEAICYSPEVAFRVLSSANVQLLFLDVEMPHLNGFQLLEKLPRINFEIIFTTSYDQYAIKAFRCSALDYLLKPVDREELQSAVKKALARLQSPMPQQFEILLQKINSSGTVSRIALPTMEGLQLVPMESIICCLSSSNYTIFHLKDKQKLTVSRTLKEIEEMLEDHHFLRVHHSHLVNVNEIRKYIRGEGGQLVMSDGSTVDVSRSKKEILLKKLHSVK